MRKYFKYTILNMFGVFVGVYLVGFFLVFFSKFHLSIIGVTFFF